MFRFALIAAAVAFTGAIVYKLATKIPKVGPFIAKLEG